MKVLLDLNVLLDVIQQREPFYKASVAILSQVAEGRLKACIPGHALTTIYHLVTRYASAERANEAIDWLLARLQVIPEDVAVFRRARGLAMNDFEDAVTASAAEAAGCQTILTRNLSDFAKSPIPAITPEEWLNRKG